MANSKELLEKVIKEVVRSTFSNKVEVEISETLVYLSQKDEEILFGARKELEYLTEKKVNIFSEKSKILSVPVITGADKTKVYVTNTTKNILGVEAPISYPDEEIQEKIKEEIKKDNKVKIVGPNGEIVLENGVSVRARFITMAKDIAEFLGYKNGDIVKVSTEGIRSVIYENVKIIFGNENKKFHIDLDEANASDLKNGDIVEIQTEVKDKNSKNKKEKISYKFVKDGLFTKIL